VISQTGDVMRGGLALFALGIGMGAPLLLIGASAGQFLPKAGPWMDTVKQFFGILMLGVAIWMISRIVPPAVTLGLWAVLAFVTGYWLLFMGTKGGGVALHQPGRGGHRGQRTRDELPAHQELRRTRCRDQAGAGGRQDRDARLLCGLVCLVQGDGEVHVPGSRGAGRAGEHGAAAGRRHGQR
jgi:hypothetical protein